MQVSLCAILDQKLTSLNFKWGSFFFFSFFFSDEDHSCHLYLTGFERLKNIYFVYLFIRLYQVLVEAGERLSCIMWDPVL